VVVAGEPDGTAHGTAPWGAVTLDEDAELMTCSISKISRLEAGKGIP
jgi:hypothetical protein